MYKCSQNGNNPVGMNQSPPLTWTAGPPGTKSYAVTLNHVASSSAHWAIWDIPVDTTSLPMNIDHVAMPPAPAGAKQCSQNLDGFTGIGYLGPCPQAVNARQNYRYVVWALGVTNLAGVTSTSSTATVQAAVQAAALTSTTSCYMDGPKKACAALTGTQIHLP
jgi:Raf kinase inhibitor-like YbhB/YbcL family protein